MKIESSIVEDNIEIVNSKDETVLNIPFRINLTASYERVNKARYDFKVVSQTEDVNAIGEAVIALFVAVFGEDITEQIINYYQKDYITMLTDMTPYFSEVIYPALENYREKTLAAHKRAKR